MDTPKALPNMALESYIPEAEVALIGMAGRFPGAPTTGKLWESLCHSREMISRFTEEELDLPFGAAELPLNYVLARGILEDIELFDAEFFAFTPRDAEITDPQQRLFLECAWEALEDGGCAPDRHNLSIGVFASVGSNSYINGLLTNPKLLQTVTPMQVAIGNEKDHIATRTSYKLDLDGPSINVNTTCSSSLVAVHMACQSLLTRECDAALAGGAAIGIPQKSGYLFQEGGILSPDGHCRPFDALAAGTVPGSGVGVVLLKRLADAIAARDRIYAVIKGSAVNNDGARKVGYMAPSVEGQAKVIASAQAAAGVSAGSISYVEAHGTGTRLGDPIEVRALTRAFQETTSARCFCALGSVKSNLGHLDAASGVTGLIKTALALSHKLLPPTLNFEAPNPEIRFEETPFYVQTQLSRWERRTGPLLAGVSSFGIGGTNAHLILEEAPAEPPRPFERTWFAFPVSAKSPTAARNAARRLDNLFASNPDVQAADAAYTLHTGRNAFSYRAFLIGTSAGGGSGVHIFRSHEEAVAAAATNPAVRFHFPAWPSVSQCGANLFEHEPAFRSEMEICGKAFRDCTGFVLATPDGRNDYSRALAAWRLCVQYSLARVLLRCGIRPARLSGEGIGELAAACAGNKLDLREALRCAHSRTLSAVNVSGYLDEIGQDDDLPHELIVPIMPGAACLYDACRMQDLHQIEPPVPLETNEVAAFQVLIASLWTHGASIDWSVFDEPSARKMSLPQYPFERSRFWFSDPASGVLLASAGRANTHRTGPGHARDADAAARVMAQSPENAQDYWELVVAECWRELLGVEELHPNDDFFELGGDSLTAAQVITRLRQRHAAAELTLVFEEPTLRGLAAAIAKLQQTS